LILVAEVNSLWSVVGLQTVQWSSYIYNFLLLMRTIYKWIQISVWIRSDLFLNLGTFFIGRRLVVRFFIQLYVDSANLKILTLRNEGWRRVLNRLILVGPTLRIQIIRTYFGSINRRSLQIFVLNWYTRCRWVDLSSLLTVELIIKLQSLRIFCQRYHVLRPHPNKRWLLVGRRR